MSEFGDGFAGDLGGPAVERKGTIGKPEFAKRQRRAAKGVGLDCVAAGREISPVDLANQIRAALADDLRAVFEAEEVTLDIEIAPQYLGPHRAVAEYDAVG